MKKLLRRAALVASSLGLSFGWAGVAAANVGMGDIGAGSNAVISCNVDETYTLENGNTATVTNNNTQNVVSGEVNVQGNRNVGYLGAAGATSGGNGVMSGSVTAANSVGTSLTVNNTGSTAAALGGSGSGGGTSAPAVSMGNVGAGSNAEIDYDYTREAKVTNNTTATVTNNNTQNVVSGEVNVQGNRNVDSVSSGSASASSTSSTTVTISN